MMTTNLAMATVTVQPKRIGLAYWMQQVLEQADKAADGFKPDPVHDLRTALRRCRSLADGLMVFDPDPAWKKMKRAGKQLFQSLGTLRDTHVLREWVEKLAPQGDATAQAFADFLNRREQELQAAAATTLQQFDWNKWSSGIDQLSSRATRIPQDSPLFAHLALERWHRAHALHRQALRNRTKVSFHDLRIGIKRFRYTLENFLPNLHEFWGEDLKEVQDALGDVHDLDVLWSVALSTNALPDATSREWWRSCLSNKRQECLEKYRRKMVGTGSLWPVWRSALPKPEQLRALGLRRLEIWASVLDPNAAHARHVARLALEVFHGLGQGTQPHQRESHGYVLQAAALMHDVGRSKTNKGHHKESARLIRKLSPPLGWTADDLRIVSLVARYHRGALPSETQKSFSVLPKAKKWAVQLLGGILRLACACDHQYDTQIRHVDVESSHPVLRLRAEGYNEATPLAEHLAAARHLLEIAYHRPVFIVPSQSRTA
jgi:CHAD domain-containing protein